MRIVAHLVQEYLQKLHPLTVSIESKGRLKNITAYYLMLKAKNQKKVAELNIRSMIKSFLQKKI